MGRSRSLGSDLPLFRIVKRNGRPADVLDGLVRRDGSAWGAYIHGVFDNDGFRGQFLRSLRERSGRAGASSGAALSYHRWKEEQYDELAEFIRRHADIEKIYRLAGLGRR
jgi:adenosylcobyric acid synthase